MSGRKILHRGILIEEIIVGDGNPPYFKQMANTSDIVLTVSLPFYPGCPM